MAHPTLTALAVTPAATPVTARTAKIASPLDNPLEGDALSPKRRSEHPSAYESIAFVEGSRVLTITWLPPALDA